MARGQPPGRHGTRLALANSFGELERFDGGHLGVRDTARRGHEDALSERARLIALNNLGWYLREARPGACRRLRGAGTRNDAPTETSTLDTLAVIHLGQGDARCGQARSFDRLLKVGTDDPTILYHGAQHRGRAWQRARRLASAARHLLVERKIDFPEAKDAARLIDKLGR